MDWQELAVAVIVGLAVVSLYRHLRGMFAMPKGGAAPACHGCDDCGEAEAGERTGPEGAVTPAVTPTVTRARR